MIGKSLVGGFAKHYDDESGPDSERVEAAASSMH